jgi:hypothetical protein
MMIILTGLICINIATQFMIDIKSNDHFAFISYLLVSSIWIDLIRVSTEGFVQMVDRWIKEENEF